MHEFINISIPSISQADPNIPAQSVNGQLIDTVCLNGVYEMAAPYTCREAWLAAGADLIAADFRVAGYRIPEKMRFSIGFPSTGRHGATLGECWSDTHSRDRTHEIFIRADQDDPVEVLAILMHEMVHAVVGVEARHGPLFKKCALAIGLKGPMRHTTASPTWRRALPPSPKAWARYPMPRSTGLSAKSRQRGC